MFLRDLRVYFVWKMDLLVYFYNQSIKNVSLELISNQTQEIP